MTLEELLAREGIRKTIANYTMAGDRLRIDEFVAQFTEDGVLESDGVVASDAFHYQGRHALRDWFGRWSQPAAAGKTHQATFVRHHLSSMQIEVTSEDGARARTYWVAYTDIGPDHAGYYIDVFQKVDGRWLIANRKVRMDWRSPHSLFSTAIAHSR
jgi:3-phenylpropionate/cinnamic acid dioxygenase small subunit